MAHSTTFSFLMSNHTVSMIGESAMYTNERSWILFNFSFAETFTFICKIYDLISLYGCSINKIIVFLWRVVCSITFLTEILMRFMDFLSCFCRRYASVMGFGFLNIDDLFRADKLHILIDSFLYKFAKRWLFIKKFQCIGYVIIELFSFGH